MNIEANVSEKIAITKKCGDNKIFVQMYGPHSLNKDGTVMAFEEQMAIVSHYLHNKGHKYAKSYESKAKGLIEDIYSVHKEEGGENASIKK